MGLRNFILAMVVFGALPMILMRPQIGVLLWSWLGFMNPHRFAWGWAENFSWAQVVAAVTLIGLVVARVDKRLPRDGIVYVLIAFGLWMVVTTFFAIYPDSAWGKLDKVLKILLMTFVTMMLIKDWRYFHALIWVTVLSLGFYGVKGGFFTLTHGGQYMVLGPEGSFFQGNTTLGLALLMVLPLMRYLQIHGGNRWVRRAMLVAMTLTAVAILGTYSRGALVGIVAMGFFLILKSPYRGRLLLGSLLLLIPFLAFLPQQWHQRMETITNYQEDPSAMGRIRAWQFTGHLVAAHPVLGGGFNPYTPETYQRYAPHIAQDRNRMQGPHSNYFKALGEHGVIGLFLYLGTGILAYLRASGIIRQTRGHAHLKWAADLAAMLQVGLVGYAVAGLFLGMTYFDLYYHFLALLVILPVILKQQIEAGSEPEAVREDRQSAGGVPEPVAARGGPP